MFELTLKGTLEKVQLKVHFLPLPAFDVDV